MGGTASGTDIAMHCRYTKRAFRKQIDMIHDAHQIVLYYSKFLLSHKMPSDLGEYPNYDQTNEEYFNTRRRDQIAGFENYGINNFYDFYKLLDKLPNEYKRSEATQDERQKLIEQYVEIAQLVLRTLVEELYGSCDVQGRPRKN